MILSTSHDHVGRSNGTKARAEWHPPLRHRWRTWCADRLTPVGRGNTVCIRSIAGAPTELKLAAHRFWLHWNPGQLLLVDRQGTELPIGAGKNVVGRERHNDVVVNPRYAGVSGKHVLVEPIAGERVLLTDVSTKGTFVPPQCVA